MACQTECLTQYSCDQKTIFTPPEGAILEPWIECKIGNFILTLGNNSAPTIQNTACISSMNYGFEAGRTSFGIDFEVLDLGGVAYRELVRALNKTLADKTQEASNIKVQFGWLVKDCESGNVKKISTANPILGVVTQLDQTVENAVNKIKFSLRSPFAGAQNQPTDVPFGDRNNKIHLKEALRKLFTQVQPIMKNVRFEPKEKSSNPDVEWEFKDGGKDGPLGYWNTNGLSSLAAARAWLTDSKTKNDRGILIIYDASTASVVLKESPTRDTLCNYTIGTYIVNGGNCSPVLEFSPTIKWDIPTVTGAVNGGGAAAGAAPIVPNAGNMQKAGPRAALAVSTGSLIYTIPDDAAQKLAEGGAAQMEANFMFEMPRCGMEAELKVIGDPFYLDPYSVTGEWVSIVYINPFFLNDCTWISQPTCNPILSNKHWMLKGVNHQISDGTFTTTLKLMLALPNSTLPFDQGLGGGGEKFVEGPAAAQPK